MESLSRVSFLLLAATVVFHLFSSATAVEARDVGEGDGSTESKKWCVPKTEVSDDDLQKNLEWACGQKDVDCGPIKAGAACSESVNARSRAAFAMNSYYRKHETEPGSCDFRGTAEVMETANILEELDKERSVMTEVFALL
ncbi:hypothetical protein V6N11_057195 [Hibiscus sabdariffa]|uniref:X8 domain-containing protein n=1 Tax=Hibiscus sabdariffa TaxID=183260 RepID=A0ABR2NKE5_9ROSI